MAAEQVIGTQPGSTQMPPRHSRPRRAGGAVQLAATAVADLAAVVAAGQRRADARGPTHWFVSHVHPAVAQVMPQSSFCPGQPLPMTPQYCPPAGMQVADGTHAPPVPPLPVEPPIEMTPRRAGRSAPACCPSSRPCRPRLRRRRYRSV
jgi:hypothetical protein